MAQYGGDQYVKQDHQTDEHVQNQHHSTTVGHDIGGTGHNVHSTMTGQNIGGTGTTMGMGGGHGYEEGKQGGAGGILHRSGSGSSSSEGLWACLPVYVLQEKYAIRTTLVK
ncbi:hypothetical protein Tco_0230530 [Tanacetum coccineum]